MNKEETLLLYKDLSGRTTYGTKIKHDNGIFTFDSDHCGIGMIDVETSPKIILSGCYYGDNIKPYLFPLSSMTEEQEYEWDNLFTDPMVERVSTRHTREDDLLLRAKSGFASTEYLDKNFFDYRGLIPKGLALDATGLNIY